MRFPYHVPGGLALAVSGMVIALLAGCSPAVTAKLCAYDAAGQPILGTLAAGIADPTVQVVVKADNTIVHPAVVAFCASQVKPQ